MLPESKREWKARASGLARPNQAHRTRCARRDRRVVRSSAGYNHRRWRWSARTLDLCRLRQEAFMFSIRLFNTVVLAALPLMLPRYAVAATWNVPIAGNIFSVEPGKAVRIDRRGATGLS